MCRRRNKNFPSQETSISLETVDIDGLCDLKDIKKSPCTAEVNTGKQCGKLPKSSQEILWSEIKEEISKAKKELGSMAAGIACHNSQKSIGQVKVSICNSSNLSGVNSKGLGQQSIANDLATALGAAAAIGQ